MISSSVPWRSSLNSRKPAAILTRRVRTPTELSSAQIRVLHVITTYGPVAGAAQNTLITVNNLPSAHFNRFIALPSVDVLGEALASDVVPISIPHLVRPIRPWSDFLAFWELYRLCRKERFDVVHTHNAKDGFLGRWAAWLAGVPVVIHTVHNLSFRASRYAVMNRFYAALERVSARITSALLCVSTENVRDSLKQGIGSPSQYRVVYSGLEFERYRVSKTQEEARQDLCIPTGGPVVGWFGRFNYQKDPITFIKAARIIADRIPHVSFLVCGADPLGEDMSREVQDLIRSLSLTDHVHLLGFRNDLPLILKAVDCVMHSSRYEGMGRTVCESLLCHRPVIATNVDGVREVIISGERGGLLVPTENPTALAEATLQLLSDPAWASRLASAGYQWVERNLSATQMMDAIVELYRQLLMTSPGEPLRARSS
jgi:glycosyltransferase involved in cell wall biosynthesis